MDNEIRATLQAARDLISDPARWAQGTTAWTAAGRAVEWSHPAAISWSADAAVAKCADDVDLYLRVIVYLRQVAGGPVDVFNDTHPHDAVLALFDATLAAGTDAD